MYQTNNGYNNNNYYSQQGQQTYPRYTQSTIQPTIVNGLKGRPVTSIDEVRAMGIDFDGSIFYFPDLANKRIYTKQINPDGTASLNMYELKEIPSMITTNNNYITREEFENVINQLSQLIQEKQPSKKEEQSPNMIF